jgi:hypothetical protein
MGLSGDESANQGIFPEQIKRVADLGKEFPGGFEPGTPPEQVRRPEIKLSISISLHPL